jgi:hypothetical protein
MNLMTRDDFDVLLEGPHRNYYLGRWEYFSVVLEIIQKLDVASILEMGPGWMPVVKDADIMLGPEEDHFGRPGFFQGKVIIHDATIKPWPIGDRAYDLLVALNVFEHLDNKQSRAFREAMRVAKRAILSFPYGWQGGAAKWMHHIHRDIDRELILDWTLGVEPKHVVEIPRTGSEFSKGPRLIYYWEFD